MNTCQSGCLREGLLIIPNSFQKAVVKVLSNRGVSLKPGDERIVKMGLPLRVVLGNETMNRTFLQDSD